ncbi:MAG: hypothetical protein R3C11_06200 [Planctomycetaceae bacterium]
MLFTLRLPDGSAEGEERKVMNVPGPADVIEKGDTLFIVGPDKQLAQLPRE